METQQKPPAAPSSRPPQPGGAAKTLFPLDSDTHLLDRLNAIYKYRSLVITVFLLVMLAALVRTYTTTPLYRATTSVLIEDEHGGSVAGFNATGGTENYQDPEPYFQTQLRILQGRELATSVVKRLHLETVPELTGQGPRRTWLGTVVHTMKSQALGSLRALSGGEGSTASSQSS